MVRMISAASTFGPNFTVRSMSVVRICASESAAGAMEHSEDSGARMLLACGVHCQTGLPPLQEAPYRGLAFQADGQFVCVPRARDIAGLGQQFGTCRPVGLVVGEARVRGDGAQCLVGRCGSLQF